MHFPCNECLKLPICIDKEDLDVIMCNDLFHWLMVTGGMGAILMTHGLRAVRSKVECKEKTKWKSHVKSV